MSAPQSQTGKVAGRKSRVAATFAVIVITAVCLALGLAEGRGSAIGLLKRGDIDAGVLRSAAVAVFCLVPLLAATMLSRRIGFYAAATAAATFCVVAAYCRIYQPIVLALPFAALVFALFRKNAHRADLGRKTAIALWVVGAIPVAIAVLAFGLDALRSQEIIGY
ncbi:hypothetical protein [Lysobacter sp. Root690]|uniref:hypothetical protein n=1 Tax=Lysobacter sp. Root690 TaxID=1736588 RepID=UPI0012F92E99|nr:hypothetical protein [Lysobacter sp. Root690]